MGINIVHKAVQLDYTHNRGVNTNVGDNPSRVELGEITVHQVFSRNKDHKHDGDGNPLLYALKGIKQYTIVPMYRQMVLRNARSIVEKVSEQLSPDLILPVPSSNAFVGEIADLASDVFECPVLPNGFIRKKTLGEMVDEYGGDVPKMMPSHQRLYKQQIGVWRKANPDILISMKDVDTGIRGYFSPMVIDGEPPDLGEKHVLVVDDLMASGSTLNNVANIVQEFGASMVTGLCFLGRLPGED